MAGADDGFVSIGLDWIAGAAGRRLLGFLFLFLFFWVAGRGNLTSSSWLVFVFYREKKKTRIRIRIRISFSFFFLVLKLTRIRILIYNWLSKFQQVLLPCFVTHENNCGFVLYRWLDIHITCNCFIRYLLWPNNTLRYRYLWYQIISDRWI